MDFPGGLGFRLCLFVVEYHSSPIRAEVNRTDRVANARQLRDGIRLGYPSRPPQRIKHWLSITEDLFKITEAAERSGLQFEAKPSALAALVPASVSNSSRHAAEVPQRGTRVVRFTAESHPKGRPRDGPLTTD